MLDKTADEKTLKAAMLVDCDAAAMRLAPYGIKMGSMAGKFPFKCDARTGEKLAVTNQRTGDVTARTAAELNGAKEEN